jgi:hypothetical protein
LGGGGLDVLPFLLLHHHGGSGHHNNSFCGGISPAFLFFDHINLVGFMAECPIVLEASISLGALTIVLSTLGKLSNQSSRSVVKRKGSPLDSIRRWDNVNQKSIGDLHVQLVGVSIGERR